jgi:hypothetical protein
LKRIGINITKNYFFLVILCLLVFIAISDSSKSFVLASLNINSISNVSNNTILNQKDYDEIKNESQLDGTFAFCGGHYCPSPPPGAQPVM